MDESATSMPSSPIAWTTSWIPASFACEAISFTFSFLWISMPLQPGSSANGSDSAAVLAPSAPSQNILTPPSFSISEPTPLVIPRATIESRFADGVLNQTRTPKRPPLSASRYILKSPISPLSWIEVTPRDCALCVASRNPFICLCLVGAVIARMTPTPASVIMPVSVPVESVSAPGVSLVIAAASIPIEFTDER